MLTVRRMWNIRLNSSSKGDFLRARFACAVGDYDYDYDCEHDCEREHENFGGEGFA